MTRRRFLRATVRSALAASAGGAACSAYPLAQRPGQPGAFAIGLIGDIPYSPSAEQALRTLYADFDPGLAFVLHVGDLKGGTESCADELLERRAALLRACPVPLMYTPGDNEWTDCHRASAGGFDPLERLARLRELFFATAAPVARPELADRFEALVRQSDTSAAHPFPENLRWRHAGVVFVTINLPGSRNAQEGAHPPLAHNRLRNAANAAWLREAFALASRTARPLLVIAAQADPDFEHDTRRPVLGAPVRGQDEYSEFRSLLSELSTSFRGQVLFLHGDSHRFRSDRPLLGANGERLGNFARVECFGHPIDASWVRIRIDPGAAEPFLVAIRHAGRPQPL